MTKEPIKIATAQSFVSEDIRANGAEIRELMRQAKGQGAQLIHFAEGALSGYVKSQIHDWQTVDWDELKEELEAIRDLAGELGLWVVLGCNHPLSEPNRPHNSLYIISADGNLHTRYDKQWLSHTEVNDWYTPGNSLCVFELDGWRLGCAICIEIQFPELFMAYAKEGVDCMLYSAYSDSAMFGIQAQGYAASHTMWLSFATPTQMSHTLPSHMIGPSGELQTLCQTEKSSLCLNLLDIEDPAWKVPLHYAKPWRAKARKGDIYRARYVDDSRSREKRKF